MFRQITVCELKDTIKRHYRAKRDSGAVSISDSRSEIVEQYRLATLGAALTSDTVTLSSDTIERSEIVEQYRLATLGAALTSDTVTLSSDTIERSEIVEQYRLATLAKRDSGAALTSDSRLSSKRLFSVTPRRSNLIGDLYVNNIRQFKPKPLSQEEVDAAVKKFQLPGVPTIPQIHDLSVDQVKEYESSEVETQQPESSASAEDLGDDGDWFVFDTAEDASH
ncbi:ATP14 [Candida oxycetoniae]|uniref:ATP14 n=1 Tax=Candida oxycetoniae TaxID=497107 RepID=A0AAI9T0Q3_9ASCO|nr:ATP14 [Candida oxycetoniae]KAI3406305.2 ATP14 [Candida oxycetoniae]